MARTRINTNVTVAFGGSRKQSTGDILSIWVNVFNGNIEHAMIEQRYRSRGRVFEKVLHGHIEGSTFVCFPNGYDPIRINVILP